jgi:hypothetical protein
MMNAPTPVIPINGKSKNQPIKGVRQANNKILHPIINW